jgi:signal transduction histidine kinase
MDSSEKELTKIQSRDRVIRIFMLILLGALGTTLLSVYFLDSDLQGLYERHMNVRFLTFLLLGLIAFFCLFMGYLVVKEKVAGKLQRDIVEQRIASEVLDRRLRDLQTVLDLTSLVKSEMFLSTILDVISGKALETLDGDQSSLFLYDPQVSKLRCVSMRGGEDERVSKALVEVGKGIAGWVVKHGEPLLLDEDLSKTEFRDFVKRDKRIKASLCIPLMVRNQPRGVLNITVFDKNRRFTESDLKLAFIFAENAAIAIDKAGLYEKLKEQTKTLRSAMSELKSTQHQAGGRERLRALGNLASGMSYDFSTALTAILSGIRLLSREMEEQTIPEDSRKILLQGLSAIEQVAVSGAEGVKHVQQSARTYEWVSQKDFEELQVNTIVLEAVGITRAKWKDEAESKGIHIAMETDLGKISNPVGDHSDIREVLTSMIFNSVDALPQGGKIKIVTRMQDHKAEIKVIDNGLGMSQETKSRIFQPFFTTKSEKADGMALSLAHGIISRHNGQMAVESKPGQGTTFIITLPIPAGSGTQVEKKTKVTTPPA